MTYQSDPTRWTESPGDAPELLRSAIRACADEGPSDFQMRSLALKLAVVGGGAAVIASAASASAASASAASAGTLAGGTIAASGGGALSLVKVAAVSVALIGAAATGAVMVRRDAAPAESTRQRAPAIAAPVSSDAPVQAPGRHQPDAPAPTVERLPAAERAVTVSPAPVREAPSATRTDPAGTPSASDGEAQAKRAERREARHQARIAARDSARSTDAPSTSSAVSQVELPRELSRSASARGASTGELEMLHHARAALSVRPLSAFALTEQHRASYPNGVFTQERDALAVEALLRAGDMDRARSLAEQFIAKYPSSPHAHRFRETMKLQ